MSASDIIVQGRSSHPHVLLSTPSEDDDTYTSDFDSLFGVYRRWRMSITLDEYDPIYFPSSNDE